MRGAIRLALIVAAAVCSAAPWFVAAAAATAYDWGLPAGVPPPPVPADNAMSPAKVALGRRLFYDADLSIDGTIACATCHEQHRAFTEGNATHGGVRGAQGRRNVMGLTNVGYLAPLTWANPGLRTLEQQVRVPILGDHPVEMGMGSQEAVLSTRLGGDPCYRRMFAAAFGEEHGAITLSSIAKAIAAFERTLLSFEAPYDRYRRGDHDAMTDAARRGETLFFGDRFRCASCHAGVNFTDMRFHRIGAEAASAGDALLRHDAGLGEETHRPRDDGKFRTAALRNVALTGPYLHDGQAKTLSDAIRRHFASSGTPPNFNDGDLDDLVSFLDALTDRGFVSDPRFSLPKTACATNP